MTLSDVPLLILAGGRATRLGPLSDDTPKFLVQIGQHTRFADVQLGWAKRQGFRRVVLSIGYKGEQIREYCDDGSRFGLSVRYVEDGSAPLGTAGAVKKALVDLPLLACVLYGDTILELDCQAAVDRLAAAPSALALMTVLKHPPEGHTCNADFDGTWVTYAKTTPAPEWQHIDYGFLVLRDAFVRGIAETTPLDLAVPLEAASRARRLVGLGATVPFCEINTPEAVAAFKQRFAPNG